MEAITVVFEQEKDTKNTIRYQEVVDGMPPKIGTLYLQKWAAGKNPPGKLVVTISEMEVK